MPQDNVEQSYEIYSQLLPGDKIEWGNVPRTFWLMRDATTAVPPDTPCATGGMMNPHEAIQAPPEQQKNLAELLADFDNRCHDQYILDGSQFHLKLPVHLLNAQAQERYEQQVAHFLPPQNNIMQAPPTPDEFKGAEGLHSFSAVYFNKAHTLAMTEIGMYCGGLCGNWTWVVLEQRDGHWHTLPWVSMMTVS